MGVLYGWQKEYLLEHMSFGQIALYLNEGLRFKYPKPAQTNNTPGISLVGASDDEIRNRREALRKQYGVVEGG